MLPIVLWLVAAAAPLAAMAGAPGGQIYELDPRTLDAALDNDGPWLLTFYNPMCGHCKRLMPVLDDFVLKSTTDARVGRVDVVRHRAIGKRFGITRYPTIYYVRDGSMYQYKGPRLVTAFNEFTAQGFRSAAAEPLPPPGDGARQRDWF